MAKATLRMPEEFLVKISRLGKRTDEIVPRVLEKGGYVVEGKVRSNLQNVIGSGINGRERSTGELAEALGVSSARRDRDGNFNVKVGFSEPRTDGASNALIAGVLEYGKHGQPARPFLKPAKLACKNRCIETMIKAFESEVDRG